MEKLTKERAIENIEEIQRQAMDPESAHGLEDNLYGWFIKTLHNDLYTLEEAKEVAAIVLKSKEIDFERWCA